MNKKKLQSQSKLALSCCLLFAPLAISAVPVSSERGELTISSNATVQQNKKVTGTIVDSKTGEAIIGANVIVEGTTIGTVTDFDGNFTLEVPQNGNLVISSIGYIRQTIKPTGNKLNIKLAEDNQNLEEVIVVGYSSQKKESLTGSMQSIKKEKLTDITTPSVENMLNGKAPGVYVSPGSGQPGSTGSIIIRGKSTINGSTDPLWVIDGVIVGSGSGALNPADIETMTILKDAASTAIYGSQGANGVIVVTTKKGRMGEATINASVKLGITQLNSGNLKVMNGAELYDLYSNFSNVDQVSFPRWNEELRNSNFSWWDHATKNGFAQDYNVSIAGGTEKMSTFISLGMYDESGAVKGYDFRRFNTRFNVSYKPYEWLTLKPLIAASRRDIDDAQYSVSSMYSNLPWDSPYDEDGNIVPHYSPLWVNSNSTNYMYDLQWNHGASLNYEFMGNFDFDVKFTDWLTFSSVNNFKFQSASTNTYSDPRSSSAMGVKGRLYEYQSTMERRYTNQILRFNKSFDKHSVNALVAYEFNDYSAKAIMAQGTGLIPGFEVLDVTAVPEKVGGSKNEWAVQSVLFNGNYMYDSKYMAQLSLRRDGASNFGDNQKYGNFFSVSGGWNINREAFFQAEWVDQLKLRASYGSVGNRPTSLYPQYDLYSVSQSYNENSGALISQIGNRDLTWEKTYTTGIGVDFAAFNRLRITADYYDKRTSNLLYQVPVSGVTGVTSIWQNVGEVSNKGFEIAVSGDIIARKDLFWTVDANIGLNRNKVQKLYSGKDQMIVSDGSGIAGSAGRLLRKGLDADTWYLREWAGVDVENGSPLWYKTVTDANGNKTRETTSKYAEADEVTCGAYTPDFFGGFSTNLTYKNFDLSAVFGYSVGGKIYNYTRQEYDSDGAYSDRNQMRLQDGWTRWEKPGDIATHPVAAYNNKSNSNKCSSRYLEDGDYLKMRSLTVGYNLALPQYYVKNLRLFFSGENLFTITNYSGVDPEIPPVDGRIIGTTTTVYPSTRKFMFGINITL
ncbi:MAG: TonB-dependent receptor [Bacteroidales bacterium]